MSMSITDNTVKDIRRSTRRKFSCPSCKYNRAAFVVTFCIFHHAAIPPYLSVAKS